MREKPKSRQKQQVRKHDMQREMGTKRTIGKTDMGNLDW
jgi:hypothetical protein